METSGDVFLPSGSSLAPSVQSSSLTPNPAVIASSSLDQLNSDQAAAACAGEWTPIRYAAYESEDQLHGIMTLIENDLSEPYSIYTYRYFLHQWPQLSFLAMDKEKCVGVVVCRLDVHGHVQSQRGYIAMLAVSKEYRKRRIGTSLVQAAIHALKEAGADEIVLETEYTNKSAIALYQQMGFIKDKRLYRYYLNGVDAFRLKLFCKDAQ